MVNALEEALKAAMATSRTPSKQQQTKTKANVSNRKPNVNQNKNRDTNRRASGGAVLPRKRKYSFDNNKSKAPQNNNKKPNHTQNGNKLNGKDFSSIPPAAKRQPAPNSAQKASPLKAKSKLLGCLDEKFTDTTASTTTSKTEQVQESSEEVEEEEAVEEEKKAAKPVQVQSQQPKQQVRKISMDLTGSEGEQDNHEEEKEEDEDGDFVPIKSIKKLKEYQRDLFSELIDQAARDQWELLEVGRLVRLFTSQWAFKKKKTARFLRRYCPELVNIDFLEGLQITLSASHVLKIFERGSGNSQVMMNKISTALENGFLQVKDKAFIKYIEEKTRMLETNEQTLEYLYPILESCSKVEQVGILLQHLSQHWHVQKTQTLVQEILLTQVFDDLDGGDQEDLLKYLPFLQGRLDFPNRLDAEDADEKGNLKGLIASEEEEEESDDETKQRKIKDDESSDEETKALGVIASEDESEEDDEQEDGETDSEEEEDMLQPRKKLKRHRNPFILDEASEDEEMVEEEENLTQDEEDESSDESDSD